MSRRARGIALGAVVLVAAVAATIVLTQSGSHAANAASSGVPAGFTTATVERRTLVESSKIDGTLGYSGAAEIYDRLAGTFTWLPSAGAVIGRGGTLFKIDNEPVVLMYGSVPAYRALKEGVSEGPDVGELNANLVALGYDPYGAITVNDKFSEATAAAVRRFQKARGLKETGEVELGRVVFAPGARRVTKVDVTIGEDPPGSEAEKPSGTSTPSESKPPSSSPNGTGKSPASKKKSPAHHNSKPKRGGAPKSHVGASSSNGKEGSSAGKEPSAKSSSAANKEAAGNKEGSPGGSAAQPKLVLTTTDDAQVVQLSVKATQQELAHVGEHVPVTLPDGTVVHGSISEVGTVASEASGEGEKGGGGKGGGGGNEGSGGNGENATIAVTVTLDHAVAHLDKAPVSVELVKSIRRHVLAVPATALVATAGGGFAVQALEGDRRVQLAVTPGMFANSYVEVEGAGIHEGMTVLEPQ
jgi:peptidoglycan hydrolase-like protein with peptidoglycan-binding domain